MCGILFILKEYYDSSKFDLIKYRGPDNTSSVEIDGFIFCHHRLNIIEINDASAGNQPIIKNNNYLICNGEIYNYKEINPNVRSDCEVIIDLYEKEKLADLDGDFAFVLYDKTKNKIITGRDHVGLKPLFLGFINDKLVAVSSEMKVIDKIPGIEIRIRPHKIGTICEFSFSGLGGFDGLVLNSEVCTFDYNQFNENSLTTIAQLNSSEIAVRQLIEDLLTKAVKKRIDHTDKPFAILCSGGIDSCIIAALAIHLYGPDKIHLFTMSYDNGTSYDSMHVDLFMESFPTLKLTKVKFSKDVALNSINDVIYKLESSDVNTIRASIPMFLLAKYIRENTDYKVILSGEGADELFMGYNYFSIKNPTDEEAFNESIRLVKNLYSFDVLRAERSFSANGLELRVPFLDRDFVKCVLSISGHYRKPRDSSEKHLLRMSFANLFRQMLISDRILFRQKERFSDGVSFNWVPQLINHVVEKQQEKSSKTILKLSDVDFSETSTIYYGYYGLIDSNVSNYIDRKLSHSFILLFDETFYLLQSVEFEYSMSDWLERQKLERQKLENSYETSDLRDKFRQLEGIWSGENYSDKCALYKELFNADLKEKNLTQENFANAVQTEFRFLKYKMIHTDHSYKDHSGKTLSNTKSLLNN